MTIQDYFNRLPEPYRTQAIRNTSLKKLKREANSLWQAVYFAFPFSDTPEGVDYWHTVATGELPDQQSPESQCLKIRKALEAGRRLTAIDIHKMGIYCHNARISDLRKAGFQFTTEIIRNGSKHHAVHFIPKP